ncbi:hypothetical protein BN1232_03620 [Mycobacterium lentiflavum]|uniref:Uncharacterized protein n=1 Tax=Mycobacterium lentiflavum TaxID=141349 RepID=A0A0E4CP53_MYCLN|nr:hypothetical protein [Mycobacterium lentiflavum]MEE3063948.1 hypothetical protein [Actinomycetota bacterium]ULP40740.1 hypothetical protein MJO58_17550 [Mycobacterium lentiflavum]CQD16701.1 hypothetical protein BN1232_03620 [Mycobacterium lentiflavum]
MTDAVVQGLDDSVRKLCRPLTHEGIGETSTHYIDLSVSEVPPLLAKRSLSGRLGAKAKFELNSLPFILGFEKPAEGFRNLGRGTEEISL